MSQDMFRIASGSSTGSSGRASARQNDASGPGRSSRAASAGGGAGCACVCSCARSRSTSLSLHVNVNVNEHETVQLYDADDDDDDDTPSPRPPDQHQPLFRSAAHPSSSSWLAMANQGTRGPPVLLGTLACLAIVFFLWRRADAPLELPLEQPASDLCDPFAEPGFLHYDKTQPKAARWIPFAEACDPAPDWLALFDAQDYDSLSFLANRTILILGDSVDRNGLEHLAVMLGLPRYPVPYDDFSKKGEVPEGWDERGIPWVVEVPWLDLTFTNGFMYGLDDEDNFRQQPDWHPPGMAEERVDKLFKVHTDQLKYPPSFISIHSGLWDLAFFGRQDRVRQLSTEIPLTHQRMTWWQNRMTHLLDHVNTTWPGVPVWMRKLHRVGPVGGASYDWRHTKEEDPGKAEHFSNFFTDLRIHQIREMQEQVAISAGIPSFDFGEIWEGWQSHQQMVHPLIYPGGPAYAQGLIHHIWMESVGRESWALSKARTLSPFYRSSNDSL